jgi:hypothetical protein
MINAMFAFTPEAASLCSHIALCNARLSALNTRMGQHKKKQDGGYNKGGSLFCLLILERDYMSLG